MAPAETSQMSVAAPPTPFASLQPQAPDPLLSLIALHAADPRPHKLDLGVGVYRNAAGATPVFRAVKAAEARLVETQATKAYLGPEGDLGYLELLAPLVFGAAAAPDLVSVQTPGGTGALRLAAELAAQGGCQRIWLGLPSWPIHAGIFRQAGLEVAAIPYFDVESQTIDFEAFVAALAAAEPGDLVLLHGACHNPTGADLTLAQWDELAQLLERRGATPLVDLAYQGLGDGLDEDAEGLRRLIGRCPIMIVAQSCDKNFGLYRERTGALFVHAPADVRELVRANLLQLARCAWSMPPDHGAAVVRLILSDPTLRVAWLAELADMRSRLNAMRRLLSQDLPQLARIERQRGLFALLPLGPSAVAELRDRHAVYMAGSGRINIAGLTADTIPRFAAAYAACAANQLRS